VLFAITVVHLEAKFLPRRAKNTYRDDARNNYTFRHCISPSLLQDVQVPVFQSGEALLLVFVVAPLQFLVWRSLVKCL